MLFPKGLKGPNYVGVASITSRKTRHVSNHSVIVWDTE